MNRSNFRKQLAYSDNCWRLLDETLPASLELWDRPFETTSRWNTIRLLLAHMIGAEERWIGLRLQNIPLPVNYEERPAPTWEALYADHKAIRAATYAYLEQLTDAQLNDDTPVELTRWSQPIGLSYADILFHILNHENYHRGQVITALQRFGMDPPDFDYVFLKPTEPATAGG